MSLYKGFFGLSFLFPVDLSGQHPRRSGQMLCLLLLIACRALCLFAPCSPKSQAVVSPSLPSHPSWRAHEPSLLNECAG